MLEEKDMRSLMIGDLYPDQEQAWLSFFGINWRGDTDDVFLPRMVFWVDVHPPRLSTAEHGIHTIMGKPVHVYTYRK